MPANPSVITCYHATFGVLSSGQVLNGRRRTLSAAQSPVESILEHYRPSHASSRMAGLFVTDDPAHARKYLLAEPNPINAPIHVYKVELTPCDAHALVLVDRASQLINDARVAEIAAEYWQPQGTWRFLERIAPELKVVSEVTDTDIIALTSATLAYNGDRKQARTLWP